MIPKQKNSHPKHIAQTVLQRPKNEHAHRCYRSDNVQEHASAPVKKGAISLAFVRPSVGQSVAYIANNSRTKTWPAQIWKEGPHLKSDSHIKFKVKRSKVRVTYLLNGKAYELQTWYTDKERRPASATGAMTSKVKGQGHKLTSSVRFI